MKSLFYIFQALGLGAVPYLPKVMPVLFSVLRGADDVLRDFLVQQLTALVTLLRAHMRKWLPDILQLVADFWGSTPALTRHILKLLSELSGAVQRTISCKYMLCGNCLRLNKLM